jgi:hypothetical protein
LNVVSDSVDLRQEDLHARTEGEEGEQNRDGSAGEGEKGVGQRSPKNTMTIHELTQYAQS